MKTVLIAGAGLGGLSAGLRLAKKGYQVKIIEKNDTAGGRLNVLKKDGFTFDTGPSFFAMSYEFKEFADDCGIKLPFEYTELDPLYSVNFSDSGKTFRLYKDIKKLAEQFKDIEPDFEQKMKKYLKKGGQLFHDTIKPVVKSNHNGKADYMKTLMQVPLKHFPTLFRNFWMQVAKYFDTREAREIVSLVSFFLGRTPFDTPAVYTLLSYTEFEHDGYFNVKGGMYKIITGILDELKKEGVEIEYETEISGFEEKNDKISALIDSKGKKHQADIYLVNADAAVFRGEILKRKKYSEAKLNKMKWTMGPLTIYLGVNQKLDKIDHHNYFLGSNYREYAKKVFTDPGKLEKPYYYVNVLSRSNPECAPAGTEGLFFVVPVPDLRFKPDWSDKDEIVDGIIRDFSERSGYDISDKIISRSIFTPDDWGESFNLFKGSGLGLAHNLTQIGAFRPNNYDEKFKNLFYTGASTTPGTGLPMVIISSKLAVERIEKFAGKF